jgi:hypothetical protein
VPGLQVEVVARKSTVAVVVIERFVARVLDHLCVFFLLRLPVSLCFCRIDRRHDLCVWCWEHLRTRRRGWRLLSRVRYVGFLSREQCCAVIMIIDVHVSTGL